MGILSTIKDLVREPVLSQPVLILESDDWGPSFNGHEEILLELRTLLRRYKDRAGRHPKVTLAVVLGAPDLPAMARENFLVYKGHCLDSHRFEALVKSMLEGEREGVFSLQLHGREHLCRKRFLSWCREVWGNRHGSEGIPALETEQMPSEVQSRWSRSGKILKGEKDPREEARDEALLFSKVFGREPVVAVPPTFIWNDDVEQGWAEGGVRVVCTPGRRYLGRDAENRMVPELREPIRNGSKNRFGQTYVVRSVYFEPYMGHGAQKVLDAMHRNARAGRPTLAEMHRWNFIRDEVTAKRTFQEIASLYAKVGTEFPDVAYVSTADLADAFADPTHILRENRFTVRLGAYLVRCWQDRTLRNMAALTGLWLAGWLLLNVLDFVARRIEVRKKTRAF